VKARFWAGAESEAHYSTQSWIESDRDEGQILSTSLNLWRSKIEARAWIGLQDCRLAAKKFA
jgi:hypothetical protein